MELSVNARLATTTILHDRIKVILETRNKYMSDNDAEYERENPDHDFQRATAATIPDIVKALLAAQIGFGMPDWNEDDVMGDVIDELMRAVAGNEYNPRPDLGKEELRFLIGDRINSRDCPYHLYKALTFGPVDAPLTFLQRVHADQHWEWLQKGADAKRKKLRKAQAEIVKLTGKAA